MNIVFRVDSSTEIGTGHVMRCLTLAALLKEKGARVSFICRNLPYNLSNYIQSKGFPVYLLQKSNTATENLKKSNTHSDWLTVTWKEDAENTLEVLKSKKFDWLIVDHYSLDIYWESKMRPYTRNIMVIDDLYDRKHDCDLLLNQNICIGSFSYNGLVPLHCKIFHGPECALLREEFSRQRRRKRDGTIKRIFIFFGGSDLTNETVKAMKAFLTLNKFDILVDVVIGKSNVNYEEIKKISESCRSFTLHRQVENMAELMNKSDLAIGACGTTSWERCYLGLPSLVITIALNQEEIAEELGKLNAVKLLGKSSTVTIENIAIELNHLFNNPLEVREMSESSLAILENHKKCLHKLLSQII